MESLATQIATNVTRLKVTATIAIAVAISVATVQNALPIARCARSSLDHSLDGQADSRGLVGPVLGAPRRQLGQQVGLDAQQVGFRMLFGHGHAAYI